MPAATASDDSKEFVQKWKKVEQKERSVARQDSSISASCSATKPADLDPKGEWVRVQF